VKESHTQGNYLLESKSLADLKSHFSRYSSTQEGGESFATAGICVRLNGRQNASRSSG